MKKFSLLIVLLLAMACGLVLPTPNDFPTPPMTVIVELPNYTPEPTFTPRSQPISDADMAGAESFLLILKTNLATGNDEGIAGSVLYPIEVNVKGQVMTLNSAAEFLQNYDQIFNETMLNALTEADEDKLVSGPEGVRVGNGELWFNLFCLDAACSQKEFLITQINN